MQVKLEKRDVPKCKELLDNVNRELKDCEIWLSDENNRKFVNYDAKS